MTLRMPSMGRKELPKVNEDTTTKKKKKEGIIAGQTELTNVCYRIL